MTDSASPQSAPQWASRHPGPAHPRSPGAPLGLQTRWAWHSLWSPGETFDQQISVGNSLYQHSVSVAFQYVFAPGGFTQKAQEAGEKKNNAGKPQI